MEKAMPWYERAARNVFFIFLTGFVAQVAADPLTAYHFSHLSLIAPVANLVLVPLSELLLLTGLATTGLEAVFDLPAFAWQPLHFLCAALMGFVRFFAAPEYAAVAVPPPSAVSVGAFYVVFAALSFVFRHFVFRRTFFPDAKPRLTVPELAAFPITALLVLPALVLVPPIVALRAAPPRLRATFLDVGQGDAAVIETPDGKTMVVDAGGYPGFDETRGGDPGSRIVVPFLRRRGVNRVDILAPSHPDDDHVQGVIAVARAFPVGAVLDGGVPDDGNGSCHRLRELLRQKKVPTFTARRGQTVPLGTSGVTLEILHPAEPFLTDTRSPTNANSVILRVRYKNAAILLTGDAEEAAEDSLLQSGVSLKASVLKVGHHGSRFSTGTAFVQAVRPSVAVVSCGRDNNFGHPSPDVLTRLSTVGATVYRTDHAGAVVVETDGTQVFVAPTLP